MVRYWNDRADRGVLKPEKVRKAKDVLQKYMMEQEMVQNPEVQGGGHGGKKGKLLTGFEEVTH